MTGAFRFRRYLCVFGLAVTLTLVANCSSSSGSPVSSSSTLDTTLATSTTLRTSTTVAAATSTIATTTLPAPTSTLAPSTVPPTTVPAEPLVLREDGLGPFDFGSSEPSAVVAAITAQFGPPAADNAVNYADASHVGDGYYQSLDAPYYYALRYPVGRTTCWTGSFCAEFGGASAVALTFIGWSYTGPVGALRSASSLTIAARWSDFPSMIVYPTCYTEGGGTHHGIVLVLYSAGFEWLTVDGAGTIEQHLPDPTLTRVTRMSAGEEPFQPEADC